MWYHKIATEHLVHFGIACWDDTKWQLQATGRLPRNTLVEPLLERAWGAENKHLVTSSINSMIGLCASTRTHSYSVLTSSQPGDCPSSVLTRRFAYGEESVIDHINVTPLLDNATMRPIHDLIMHTESTRMAQLCYIITRLGRPPPKASRM